MISASNKYFLMYIFVLIDVDVYRIYYDPLMVNLN